MQLSLFDELFIDNFAGGGGASTGIEIATGHPVDIAINHDPDAIAMHKINHPFTKHFCESVWEIDPRKVTSGKQVALCWFSPDCKHFSKAKGGKPVEKAIRGLAWVAVRWAATVHPRVIILENVEEFKTWGPIKDGYPDPEQKGRTFNSFVNALKKQGYEVKWQELKACDYGAPTIRKRFFLIARCDGQPIIFPKPTHDSPNSEAVKSGKLKPWRTAAEIIDWSIPCKSIFNREKPLADNTMKRIARGLKKFVLDNPEPFLIQTGYGEAPGQKPRVPDINKPLGTIVSTCKHAIISPLLTHYKFNNEPEDVDNPLNTITSVNGHYATAPSLIQYHSEQTEDVRGQSLDKPIMTVDSSPRYAIQAPYLVKYYSGDDNGSRITDPLHTITTKDRHSLTMCHMEILRNHASGQSMSEPLNTICTSPGHFALIKTYLVKWNGQPLYNWNKVRELLNTYCDYNIADDEVLIIEKNGIMYFISDIGMRMLEPKELYAAQGFPADYKIEFDVNGKKYPKTAQVARCGNSVPPPFATALVKANLPEYAVNNIDTMAELLERMVM